MADVIFWSIIFVGAVSGAIIGSIVGYYLWLLGRALEQQVKQPKSI